MTGLLMAAGQSRRFGSNKMLCEIDGEPLIRHALRQLKATLGESVLVVLGHEADKLIPLLDGTAYLIAQNHQAGLGHSIAAGVKALQHNSHAILIALADQPTITHHDYCALIDRYLSDGHPVCAQYNGRPGVPALFPQSLYAKLKTLNGDQGARAWLNRLPNLQTVPMPGAAHDIDTPEALNKLNRQPHSIRPEAGRAWRWRTLWR
ncbi:nucleotidyltransferase family protein [Marinobacter hydrocarbonoclasticus]|nr:nucleotidyltransferase family protein [Marinobacter nauticus]